MTGLEMKYFVLKPRSKYKNDPYANAARAAMYTYAYNIRLTNPELADGLETWAAEEKRSARKVEDRYDGPV